MTENDNNYYQNEFSTDYQNSSILNNSFYNDEEEVEENIDENEYLFNNNNNNTLADLDNINLYNLPDNNSISSQEIEQINNHKLLGRKTKNSGETGKHNKYSEDNMIRKIKVLFRDDLLDFINNKIKKHLHLSEIINNKIYRGKKKELLKIRSMQTYNTSVEFNINLFNTKIGDFFSDQISPIYRMYPTNFNALLIEQIYQIDNEKKVTSILDKTFLDCLKYYRKEKFAIDKYKCLEGLEEYFEKLKNKLMKENNNEEQYVDNLIGLIKELDIIYFNKTPRESKQ